MIDGRSPARLSRFPVIDTTNCDDMRDALVERYGASNFDLRRREAPFRGIGNLLQLKDIALSYCTYTTEVLVEFPGDNLIRQQYAFSGDAQVTCGGTQYHVSAHDTGITPAGAKALFRLGQDVSLITLRLDAAALQTKLAALVGTPITRAITFSSHASQKDLRQVRLRRLVAFLADEFDCVDPLLSELEQTEFEQLLMVSFLTSNTHNYSRLFDRAPLRAAPWQVRVVEEYIAESWTRPITIESLAEVTGVGTRSMFKTFSDSRGYSPMAFLKHTRLKHARRLLQAPDETTSVTGVGLTCGFNSLGHFARDYQKAFNELPSVTLAIAKGGKRAVSLNE